MRCRRSSSVSRRPWRCASASSATHSVAVLNATRCPARQARMPSAIERGVLPGPGGLDAGLAAVAVDLGLQNGGDELLVAPFLGAGALGQLRERAGRGGGFE